VEPTRITFPMRFSDGQVSNSEPAGCGRWALICPTTTFGWPTSAGIAVFPEGPDDAPSEQPMIDIGLPGGTPLPHNRHVPTPFGLEVRVFQDGAAIARVRMAGRCDVAPRRALVYHYYRCRFRKLTTAL
jgi:hypothetical protein